MITVSEMIGMLEDYDPNSEVRFGSQPSWPFEYEIETLMEINVNKEFVDKRDLDEDYEEDPDWEEEEEEHLVVYVKELKQVGYLPGVVKEEFGW